MSDDENDIAELVWRFMCAEQAVAELVSGALSLRGFDGTKVTDAVVAFRASFLMVIAAAGDQDGFQSRISLALQRQDAIKNDGDTP